MITLFSRSSTLLTITSWTTSGSLQTASTCISSWPSYEIHVHADYQRLGIASKLIEFIFRTGSNNGYFLFKLTVFKDNHKARALYSKMGFVLDCTDNSFASVSVPYLILSRQFWLNRELRYRCSQLKSNHNLNKQTTAYSHDSYIIMARSQSWLVLWHKRARVLVNITKKLKKKKTRKIQP